MVTLEKLIDAYMACRKNKRSTVNAIEYEMDYEHSLIQLRNRINSRVYQPGKSVCFIVKRPRLREIFAASFEDRIVHHYIALRLEPLFEKVFSPRTFNCRKGKGQAYGIDMLSCDIKQCSENYTCDCYVMKVDIQGFFMSIDKARLASIIDAFVIAMYDGEDKEDLRYLCKTVIEHKPQENCELHSPEFMWERLPKNKSLFTNGEGKGIAIGNLFSQLFANYYLNSLDWYISDTLCFKHSGRYVDDIYIVDTDKEKMLMSVGKIREYLHSIGLKMHPKKFYFQHYTKGIEFTGNIVKPNRKYVCNRTVNGFVASILRINRCKNARQIERHISSINSYLGYLRHCNGYAIRRKWLMTIDKQCFKWLYIYKDFKIVKLKYKYTQRYETMKYIASIAA